MAKPNKRDQIVKALENGGIIRVQLADGPVGKKVYTMGRRPIAALVVKQLLADGTIIGDADGLPGFGEAQTYVHRSRPHVRKRGPMTEQALLSAVVGQENVGVAFEALLQFLRERNFHDAARAIGFLLDPDLVDDLREEVLWLRSVNAELREEIAELKEPQDDDAGTVKVKAPEPV